MRYLLRLPLLAGCVSPIPQAVSGDRQAGVIEIVVDRPAALSYAVREFDWSEADAQALEACRNWGFTEARGLGVLCRNRVVISGRCVDRFVTRQYQCMNGVTQ